MELVLLVDYRGALRQRIEVFQSVDLDRLEAHLARAGLTTRRVHLEDVANGRVRLKGAWIHFTSTQQPGYREYLDDVLFDLAHDNHLVPRYEIFRAHENKGYQELEKRRLGLDGLAWNYYGNLRGVRDFGVDLSFPLVLKPVRGYMSRGVTKVRDAEELETELRRRNRPAGLFVYRLKQWLKRHVLRGRYHPEMYEDCPYAGGHVLQEFVPGATGDWKVLSYGDHVYAVRRGVRPGDFRASGSGRLSFDTPPDVVLDEARRIHTALDVPMSSLDLIEVEGRCHLVEFQGVHFGTWTQENAPHHFERRDGAWERIEGRRELEEEIAHALGTWLEGASSEAP